MQGAQHAAVWSATMGRTIWQSTFTPEEAELSSDSSDEDCDDSGSDEEQPSQPMTAIPRVHSCTQPMTAIPRAHSCTQHPQLERHSSLETNPCSTPSGNSFVSPKPAAHARNLPTQHR